MHKAVLAVALASTLALTAAGPREAHAAEPAAADRGAETSGASRARAAEAAGAGRGVAFDVSFGLMYLDGHLGDEWAVSTVQSTVGVALAAYPTRHVGLSAGLEGGYGTLMEGCWGECDKAYSLRVPLRAEVAVRGRFVGPYADAGLSFVNAHSAIGGKGSEHPEHITMSSPATLSLGGGYRLPLFASSLDLRAGLEVGRFGKIRYEDEHTTWTEDRFRALGLHYAMTLTAGFRWGT